MMHTREIRGTWYDMHGYVADLANQVTRNRAVVAVSDAAQLIDAQTGDVLTVTKSGNHLELSGWPCGDTFVVGSCGILALDAMLK